MAAEKHCICLFLSVLLDLIGRSELSLTSSFFFFFNSSWMRKKPRLVTNYRNFNTMTVQNKSSNYRKNADKEALFCKKNYHNLPFRADSQYGISRKRRFYSFYLAEKLKHNTRANRRKSPHFFRSRSVATRVYLLETNQIYDINLGLCYHQFLSWRMILRWCALRILR